MVDGIFEDQIHALLSYTLEQSDQAIFLCLGHLDGHVVNMLSKAESVKGNGVSAMGSSFLALSETIIRESLSARSSYALIVADTAYIVAVRVKGVVHDYVLTLGADSSKTIGAALRLALDTAEQIEKVAN